MPETMKYYGQNDNLVIVNTGENARSTKSQWENKKKIPKILNKTILDKSLTVQCFLSPKSKFEILLLFFVKKN